MNRFPLRTLKLFRINAGSCNGCDVELAATEAVSWFDVGTVGCAYTHTPADADIVLVTGPLTSRVRDRVLEAYAAVPEPKVTVAVGVCPVSCGVFRDSYAVAGPLDRYLPIDINIPGCPPRPQALLDGIAAAASLWRARMRQEQVAGRPPAVSDRPERLRGRPSFAPSSCVGCGMCVHVCAAGAIRVDESRAGIDLTLWENSCVFCGLCAHYCPTGALSFGPEWRLTHSHEDAYTRVTGGSAPKVPCGGCGEPFVPAAPDLVRRALRREMADTGVLRTLCRECRLAASVTAVRRTKR